MKRHVSARRAFLAIALLGLAGVLVGCGAEDDVEEGAMRSGFEEGGKRVYFSLKDPRYDDRGPGNYTYPISVEAPTGQGRTTQIIDGAVEATATRSFNMDTRTGFFDITNFMVKDGGRNVVFEITTARPIPKFRDDLSSEAQGWFLQLMDIYIDKDHKPGSGRTRSLPGRNVAFAPDNGWEQMILVAPQVPFQLRRTIDQITWDMDFVHMRPSIFIPDQVFVEGYQFRIFVPKSVIGEPEPHWGYQCMMMLFTPTNLEYGHFMQGKVKRFASTNTFGGADEYNGHPNVIDVLAPTADDQYRVLKDFVSSPNTSENRFAFLPLCYGTAQAPQAPAPSGAPVAQARPVMRAPAPYRREPGFDLDRAPPAAAPRRSSRGLAIRPAVASDVDDEFSNTAQRAPSRSREDRFDVGEGD